jgi:hypothetical protein
LPRERFNSILVQGLEDCRLIDWNGSSWFSCTTFDSNPHGAIQTSLCKIEDYPQTERILQVERLIPLQGPDLNRHEKNWLPFLKEGEIHFVYSSDPFLIYKPNLETGTCETVLEYIPTHDFSRFRGSAAPVPLDGGYLMLVHEVVQLPDYSRNYLHRFVYLDQDFRVEKTSKPFTFFHTGIEFCTSMTMDHEGKHMILAVGIEDREAVLCFIDLEEIRSMLFPLPPIFLPY